MRGFRSLAKGLGGVVLGSSDGAFDVQASSHAKTFRAGLPKHVGKL